MYKISDKEFKTKEKMREYLIDLIKNNYNVPLKERDFEIMKEFMTYVPSIDRYTKDRDGELTEIVGINASDKVEHYRFNINIRRLKYGRKYKYENKKDYVYVGTIVKYVPPVNVPTIDYIFTFGKYKGVNIKDISDDSYLHWLTSSDCNISKRVKGYVTKYLRYGFIPEILPLK
jgi:hypothetical protein